MRRHCILSLNRRLLSWLTGCRRASSRSSDPYSKTVVGVSQSPPALLILDPHFGGPVLTAADKGQAHRWMRTLFVTICNASPCGSVRVTSSLCDCACALYIPLSILAMASLHASLPLRSARASLERRLDRLEADPDLPRLERLLQFRPAASTRRWCEQGCP